MNGSSHHRVAVACFVLAVVLPGCCALHLLPSQSHGAGHGGGCMSGHGTGVPASPGSVPSNPTSDVQYRCPMHPDINATFASTCPKCGMAMVKGDQ